MAKYLVGIREVHVNTVEVELPDGADDDAIKELAGSLSVEESVMMEYSHSLDLDVWSVEKVPEPTPDPRPILPPQEVCPKCGAQPEHLMVTGDGSALDTVKCDECAHAWREPNGNVDTDGTVYCKFCGKEAEDAHRHDGGWVGACCWDERLRATE